MYNSNIVMAETLPPQVNIIDLIHTQYGSEVSG